MEESPVKSAVLRIKNMPRNQQQSWFAEIPFVVEDSLAINNEMRGWILFPLCRCLRVDESEHPGQNCVQKSDVQMSRPCGRYVSEG